MYDLLVLIICSSRRPDLSTRKLPRGTVMVKIPDNSVNLLMVDLLLSPLNVYTKYLMVYERIFHLRGRVDYFTLCLCELSSVRHSLSHESDYWYSCLKGREGKGLTTKPLNFI